MGVWIYCRYNGRPLKGLKEGDKMIQFTFSKDASGYFTGNGMRGCRVKAKSPVELK